MFDQELANSEQYLRNHIISSHGKGNLEDLLENGNELALDFKTRIEGRTRNTDPTEAMRLRVHDPLWMLARQWQMGEFRGNNTGTAMSVRCTVRYEDCSSDPIEPVTEQINPVIDFLARIESAVYFLDLLKNAQEGRSLAKTIRPQLIQQFPINWEAVGTLVLPNAVTKDEEMKLNRHLQNYAKTYKGKIFDGAALYKYLSQDQGKTEASPKAASPLERSLMLIKGEFMAWFEKKYKPASSTNQHWQAADLCYTVETQVAGKTYKSDNYQGGRLSWYTFDYEQKLKGLNELKPGVRPGVRPGDKPFIGPGVKPFEPVPDQVLSLPTPATFAAAPNKRLWQMEDRKVFMGNSVEEPSEANSVVMRYATMYSNDWMLFPLKTEIGKYITVKKIEVIDTFGECFSIDEKDRAGNNGQLGENEEQWQMFTNSTVGNRKQTVVNGLFYAPQLAATVEGKPIEEVKVLRDEIANMVWGVENVVPDGCGGTLDANLYATRLETIVNGQNKVGEPEHQPDTVVFGQGKSPELVKAPGNSAPQAKFSYSLQSSVPFNWIPFIPQRLPSKESKLFPFFMGGREIILRRGKMPCYIFNKDHFDLLAVRPQGSIMRPVMKFIVNGDGKVKEEPMVIHEEAVQATGIRLTKNYQRARWIGGKTYQWLGIYKRQAKTDASSGLIFDTLKKR